MQNETRPLLLQASGVTKAFYGNTVLDHVDFDLAYGEVLGLVGQNGAGKSTLVKILTGVYQKDEGSIKIEGKEAVLDSIQSANASGISIVFQELSLALNMTVADNIFIGDYPTDSLSLIKKKELYKRTQDLLNRFNVDIRPTDIVGSLTSGKRQIVEIIKAISKNPKVLILDEPTSSLEEKEIQILFEFIRNLKANNFSIIYISHHMSEIFEIVDNLLILRDGKKVCACSKNDSIPYSDTYTGIQTGLADGASGVPANLFYLNFRDVIKYFYDYQQVQEATSILINKAAFDSLLPEDQEAIRTIIQNKCAESYKLAQDDEAKYKQMLRDENIEVVEFTDEERQAFADACHEQVWPKLAQTFTQEFLDGVLNSAKAN